MRRFSSLLRPNSQELWGQQSFNRDLCGHWEGVQGRTTDHSEVSCGNVARICLTRISFFLVLDFGSLVLCRSTSTNTRTTPSPFSKIILLGISESRTSEIVETCASHRMLLAIWNLTLWNFVIWHLGILESWHLGLLEPWNPETSEIVKLWTFETLKPKINNRIIH